MHLAHPSLFLRKDHVAKELGVEVGEYTHWITNLCHDRSATSC